MSNCNLILERNQTFAKDYDPRLFSFGPKLRTFVLTCVDARVDPAHVLGLELGDAVVFRNNGGRVTEQVRKELSALAFMVAKMSKDGSAGSFELILMQHTQCGAERFADPQLQEGMRKSIGVDVAEIAIHDHADALKADIEKLRADPTIPDQVIVSGLLYDVETGKARVVASPEPLRISPGTQREPAGRSGTWPAPR